MASCGPACGYGNVGVIIMCGPGVFALVWGGGEDEEAVVGDAAVAHVALDDGGRLADRICAVCTAPAGYKRVHIRARNETRIL